jgi:DNA-binding MarR family transcriptional regulator
MNAALVRSFRKGLRALERQVELALSEQSQCCGVTPAQCHLLLEVEEGGESSVGELAASLELDGSTLSRTVDGLVRSGLLERREDPDNRRRQLVRLSSAGKAKADSINLSCDEYYRRLLAGLPAAEVAALGAALPKFAEAMRSLRLGSPAESCGGAAAGGIR